MMRGRILRYLPLALIFLAMVSCDSISRRLEREVVIVEIIVTATSGSTDPGRFATTPDPQMPVATDTPPGTIPSTSTSAPVPPTSTPTPVPPTSTPAPGSISGYVYYDLLGDGRRNPTDIGAANIKVETSWGCGGVIDVMYDTTNSAGYYHIGNLRGTFCVYSYEPPRGDQNCFYSSTTPNSFYVTIADGEDLTINFGWKVVSCDN